MNMDQIEKIKRLAIIAMFSDDDLMDMLVLKGGNALDIVYDIDQRASLDLDFSIQTEFKPNDIDMIESKMKKALTVLFNENGYTVFDLKFILCLDEDAPGIPPFWGGYRLEFKVIENTQFVKFSHNQRSLRANAIDIGPGSKKTYRIEISKWEYCKTKRRTEIDDYTVYVYTPEMIVLEKLRAICQQMPKYSDLIGKSFRKARARDFFDIYTTIEHFLIDLTKAENLQLLKDIFEAKKVPIDLITRIKNYREYHRPDFSMVEDTVKRNVRLKKFDFYFDYVVNKCDDLAKALGII